MKKLLSLLLALAMLLGCVAFAEGVDYTGTWVLTGAEASGMQMGPATLAMVGLDSVTLVLNADGTMTMTMMGMEEAGTWKVVENGISVDGGTDVQIFTYQDEVLTAASEDETMMFTREGAAPAIEEAPVAVSLANVDPVAFEGEWVLTTASILGMEVSAEEIGGILLLNLAAGQCECTTIEEGVEPYVEALTYTVAEVEGEGTVLTLSGVDETTGESVELMQLTMLEDGRLSALMDLEGLEVGYFFTRQCGGNSRGIREPFKEGAASAASFFAAAFCLPPPLAFLRDSIYNSSGTIHEEEADHAAACEDRHHRRAVRGQIHRHELDPELFQRKGLDRALCAGDRDGIHLRWRRSLDLRQQRGVSGGADEPAKGEGAPV